MAEEGGGGGWGDLGLGDWAKSGLAFLLGGPLGLAFSPAAGPAWSAVGEKVGLKNPAASQGLASMILSLMTGNLPGAASSGWGASKQLFVPTAPRPWDTPASPYGLDYGRSAEVNPVDPGAPAYGAPWWSPGGASRNNDVTVGPGMSNQLFSYGGLRNDLMPFHQGGGNRFSWAGRGAPPNAQIPGQLQAQDPFSVARDRLGMPETPDFSRVRQLLGMS